jgi:hypothetical protein
MVRLAGWITIAAAIIMIVAGVATWFTVQTQLADEKITVSEDAAFGAGQQVRGPLTAYAQAEVIEKHTLEATGGKTYAELDREDPLRETAMTSSFLRSSLFTSVVAFGVAALVVGLGIVFIFIGLALVSVGGRLKSAEREPQPA